MVLDYRFRSRDIAENWAARLLEIFKANSGMLKSINADSLNQMEFLTEGIRIGLYNITDNILIVISDSTSDNLLGIRITRSFEMLKDVFSKRYESKITSDI